MPKLGMVHREVAKVAREAAGQHYEVLMRDDLLFGMWKKQNPGRTGKQLESRFIEKAWPLYVRFARTTMGMLLDRPDVSEQVKEKIYEALVADNSLVQGRFSAAEAQHMLWSTLPERPCGIPIPSMLGRESRTHH